MREDTIKATAVLESREGYSYAEGWACPSELVIAAAHILARVGRFTVDVNDDC
jgi:hypothetical protein